MIGTGKQEEGEGGREDSETARRESQHKSVLSSGCYGKGLLWDLLERNWR